MRAIAAVWLSRRCMAGIERMDFEAGFVDGETRFACAAHGRFSEWLPDGTWTLRISMEEHLGIRYSPEVGPPPSPNCRADWNLLMQRLFLLRH
eukprot:SAG25_NODE_4549_length_792_cov_1.204906_1_plen_93_part_00